MRVCPFCSTENEAFFRFCLGCGADLDEALGPADEGMGDDTSPDGIEGASSLSAVQSIPKPRVTSKDTAVDLPAVTPEAIGEAKAEPTKRRTSVPRAIEPVAAKRGSVASKPRVARDRDKTEDAGGALKPGSPASQAVAQAAGAAKRRVARRTQDAAGGGSALHALESAGEATAHGRVGLPASTKPAPVSSRTHVRPTTAGVPIKAPLTQQGGSGSARTSVPELKPPAKKKKAPDATPKARLVIILEDGSDGTILDLSPETTTIGREGVEISFPHDDFLAKRHAEFLFDDGELNLNPLSSTNGVFLQVHQEVELDSGDVFRIGQQLLCFEMLDVVASSLEVDPEGKAIPLGSPVPEGAWGRLGQVIAPQTMGSVYLLGGSEVYLGRERGDITFPGDGFVSGLHAQISMRNGRCFLKDLGSSNGTYLRLSKATPVKRGMLVLAGQQLFRVEG